jgi:hypothetical protein
MSSALPIFFFEERLENNFRVITQLIRHIITSLGREVTLKRGQCWFPCWVTIGLPADPVLGPQEGPVLIPLLGPLDLLLTRCWDLSGSSVGSPAGYYWTSC